MDGITALIIAICTFAIIFASGYAVGARSYNSPELRQCLSQSGTTWQGGECVIILNK